MFQLKIRNDNAQNLHLQIIKSFKCFLKPTYFVNNIFGPTYFVNMVRNSVNNAVLDLFILLKSAPKTQEIQFQSPKIEIFSGKACSRTAIYFSGFAHGWLRSDQMSCIRKFQLCRPPPAGKWQRDWCFCTSKYI